MVPSSAVLIRTCNSSERQAWRMLFKPGNLVNELVRYLSQTATEGWNDAICLSSESLDDFLKLKQMHTWDDRLPQNMVEPCVPVETAPPTVWSTYQANAGSTYPYGAFAVLHNPTHVSLMPDANFSKLVILCKRANYVSSWKVHICLAAPYQECTRCSTSSWSVAAPLPTCQLADGSCIGWLFTA